MINELNNNIMRKTKFYLMSIILLMLPALITAQTRPKRLNAVRPLNSIPAKSSQAAKAMSKTSNAPMMVTGDGTQIWGSVIWSQAWTDTEAQYGIYSFNASQYPSLEPIKLNEDFTVNGGGVIYDGKFHFVNYTSSYYCYVYEYNIDDWTPTGNNGMYTYDWLPATDVTYDPVSNKVYACFQDYDGSSWAIGTIDYTSQTRTDIRQITSASDALIAIAANKNGELYGITRASKLVKIDKETGNYTEIGETGVTLEQAFYLQSATFDKRSGKLYWAALLPNDASALFEVDTTTGKATKINDFPNGEEIVALYIPESSAADGAPVRVSDLNIDFPNGQLTGNVTFTMPDKDMAGNELKGNLTYTINVNGSLYATETAAAGEKINKSLTLQKGNNKLTVITENEAGKSDTAKVITWIGYDEPDAVKSVTLNINAESGKADVSWSPVYKGVHNGYIENIKYEVVRQPDNVVVAEATSDTTFTETLPTEAIKRYSYTITPINGSERGASTTSNTVRIGNKYELPYNEDFTDPDVFDSFTIIDSNNDYCSWEIYNGNATYSYSSSNDADDWLLTPEIYIDGLHAVKFSVKAGTTLESYPERIAIYYGTGEDPTKYTELIAPTELTSMETLTAEFLPKAAGNYRIAFHAISEKNHYNLNVTDISLSEGTLLAAPAAVENLTVTAAPNGGKGSTISFIAPTKTYDGNALTGITKIETYRNETLISTISNPAQGSKQTVNDNDDIKDGLYTYRIVAYNDKGKGQLAEDSVYIGEDTPKKPQQLSLRDNGNGTAVLSWTAPGAEGINNGYVNVDSLKYNIYRNSSESADGKLVATTADTAYTLEIPLTGDQALESYSVTAVSSTGESEAETSSRIVTGAAYTVPFNETFSDRSFDNPMWWTDATGIYNFEFMTDPTGEGGSCVYYYARQAGDKAMLSTGKIDIGGTTNPKLKFRVYVSKTQEDADNTLDIIIDKAGTGETDTIKRIKCSEMEDLKWQDISLSLADYIDMPYIAIRFLATGNSTYKYIAFDDVKVEEIPLYDLSVAATAPNSAYKGKPVTVSVDVRNTGDRTANNFNVLLSTADGDVVDQQTVSTLEPQDTTTVKLTYNSKATDPEKVTLTASVDYAYDLEDVNNNADVTVEMIPSILPKATDLTISSDGKTLSWNAPTEDQTNITENFDEYKAWATEGFGDWVTYDGDGGIEYALGNPDNGKLPPIFQTAYAWAIYNPSDYDLDFAKYPNYQPHSGNQFVAAHSASSTWTLPLGHNDDWLISPELSGNAQKISFFVGKYLDESFPDENYEVLYSTTDQNPESFISLANDCVNQGSWYKVEYQLPDGAKYFAIRYVAEDQFCMFVDDITYQAVMPEILGYNIYLNGELVCNVPVTSTSYTLPTESENGTYNVTVVYAVGESAFSNDAQVSTEIQNINIGEQNEVAVYTTDGIKVAEGKNVLANLKEGIYIVLDKSTGKTINFYKHK